MGCVIGQLSINEWVAFDGLCNRQLSINEWVAFDGLCNSAIEH